MYTLSIICCFLGFYCLFNTSKKATLNQNYQINIWLQKNIKSTRILGLVLIAMSFIGMIYQDGYGAGTFSALVLLMAIASLVVIFSPLKLLKWTHLTLLFFFILLSEFIIFC